MRASRLLTILLTLSTRGRVSAAQLATELEVSVRTIYRDVEALGAAGVPVYTTRGRHGGIQLVDGYRTRVGATALTGDEADALFLSGIPGAAADLGLERVLATTQLKVLAGLPADQRHRAVRIRDRVHVDTPGWLHETEAPPLLAAVAASVWSQRRLDVRYERSDRSVGDRVLDPLGLVLKGGTWYLVACEDEHGDVPRTYRVSRVHAVTVRDDGFERPPAFDLAAFWAAYQRDYADRVYRGTAVVRLDEAGRQLLFLLGPVPSRRARTTMTAPDADGWAEADVPIESVRHAQHALLQLGEHVEVLAPAELRNAIAASARRIVDRYGPATR